MTESPYDMNRRLMDFQRKCLSLLGGDSAALSAAQSAGLAIRTRGLPELSQYSSGTSSPRRSPRLAARQQSAGERSPRDRCVLLPVCKS